jgi:hypothetical protein
MFWKEHMVLALARPAPRTASKSQLLALVQVLAVSSLHRAVQERLDMYSTLSTRTVLYGSSTAKQVNQPRSMDLSVSSC